MLKMFSTQLTGVFQKINELEEFSIEDGARLLAQAAIGDGNIYVKGFHEMKAIEVLALEGPEPLIGAKPLTLGQNLSNTDRVLLVSRYSADTEAIAFAKQLVDSGIPFAAISGVLESSQQDDLLSLADVHINTYIIKGIIPSEKGGRAGFADTIAATYIYYGLQFALEEMLSDYD